MRHALIALCLGLGFTAPALAQVSISIDRPGVSIGINLPVYPTLQRVPNYPVYYAPSVRTNYFFYDGLYWVYEGDHWYASSWYNGPWHSVDRSYVPVYLLRVPVRYYRDAPATFRTWRADAPPRWQEHWGASWAERRVGWDSWDVKSAPAPAPLPVYQRQYSGQRYPQAEQQAVILTQSYRYQPKEAVARQVFQERKAVAEARKEKKEKKDKSVPPGHQRKEDRGPPDHAKAKGLDRSDGRAPPDHAKARGLDRSDDRGPPGHAKAKGRDKDDDRGPPDHAKSKDKDKDRGEGKGRGRDKD